MRHGSMGASTLLAAVALALGACGGDEKAAGPGADAGVDLIKDGEITT